MSYNWEKIFENKSTKELYNIYKGNSYLSKDAVFYAKKELIKRNFDFENIDAYIVSWKLSDLKEDEVVYQTEYAMSKFKFISLKKYFLILFSFIGLTYFFETTRKDFDLNFFFKSVPYITIFISLLILLNNYIARLQNKTRDKRLQEIDKVGKELEKYKENKSVQEDYNVSMKKLNKEEKRMIKIVKITTILAIILILFSHLRNLGFLKF